MLLGATSAGRYFIIVDGYNNAQGPVTLNVSGVIASGQPCDPTQIAANVFTCEVGTCQDPGAGFVCM